MTRQSSVNLRGTPPAIDQLPTCRMNFRFNCSQAVTDQPIYGYDLLGLIGAATSATGVTGIVAGVKIHQIRIYYGSNSGSSVGLVWADANNKPMLKSDTLVGTAEPATFAAIPPKNSGAAFWHSYAERAQTIFTLTAPLSAIIDVMCTIVLTNGTKTGSVQTYVSSGLTAGLLYLGPLDKQTGAPKIFPVAPAAYYG